MDIKKTNQHDITIVNYGIMGGGIYFYKIEVADDEELSEAVDNLMILEQHEQSDCTWSSMGKDDVYDYSNKIVKASQLKGVE